MLDKTAAELISIVYCLPISFVYSFYVALMAVAAVFILLSVDFICLLAECEGFNAWRAFTGCAILGLLAIV